MIKNNINDGHTIPISASTIVIIPTTKTPMMQRPYKESLITEHMSCKIDLDIL